MGEHHHPALVLHHLTHPAHPLKAAFSTNGNNEGWADIHTIYVHTYMAVKAPVALVTQPLSRESKSTKPAIPLICLEARLRSLAAPDGQKMNSQSLATSRTSPDGLHTD